MRQYKVKEELRAVKRNTTTGVKDIGSWADMVCMHTAYFISTISKQDKTKQLQIRNNSMKLAGRGMFNKNSKKYNLRSSWDKLLTSEGLGSYFDSTVAQASFSSTECKSFIEDTTITIEDRVKYVKEVRTNRNNTLRNAKKRLDRATKKRAEARK